ncbi:hypothetical protein [uncultured Chryseobacterium sp.]|uniref:hypothetical protein n=1 Tax=uncultured Chryseobacterium sp. TaxID=259322 RepID=UPI0025F96BF2|nr:hypothetical protein [uncultured Chryseobacterium sp.]
MNPAIRRLIILLISCSACIPVHAQQKKLSQTAAGKVKPAIPDTLSYLKTFEIHKKEYIGKPFSFLLSKMSLIKPKTVWTVPGTYDHDILEKSVFRFYTLNYPVMNETKMLITWESPLSYRTVSSNTQRNKFYFSESEEKFYGKQVVKDILVYR